MDDELMEMMNYLKNEYGAKNVHLLFSYNYEYEPLLMFMLPNYNIVFSFHAVELIDAYKTSGKEIVFKRIDFTIQKVILEIRKKYPGKFD